MLFRSETMSFCQLIIPKDIIVPTLTKLAEIGLAQFINLNEHESSLNLPNTTAIYELVEIERQIQNVYSQCKQIKVNVPQIANKSTNPTSNEINEISEKIDKFQKTFIEITENSRLLEILECNLLEAKFVLEFCHAFFSSAGISTTRDSLTTALLHDATIDFPMYNNDLDFSNISMLEYVSGTVSIKRKYAFERMLWRVCKGNFCVTYSKDNISSYDSCRSITSKEAKQSFFLFFHGETIKIKILKICEGFHCNLIHCPESTADRTNMLKGIVMQIGDIKVVRNKTEAQRIDMLTEISEKLYPTLIKVKKMKEIYFAMNYLILDHGKQFYVGKF